jgi:hypothetical protein
VLHPSSTGLERCCFLSHISIRAAISNHSPARHPRQSKLTLTTPPSTPAFPTSTLTPENLAHPITIPITATPRVHHTPRGRLLAIDFDQAMGPRSMQENPLTLADSSEPRVDAWSSCAGFCKRPVRSQDSQWIGRRKNPDIPSSSCFTIKVDGLSIPTPLSHPTLHISNVHADRRFRVPQRARRTKIISHAFVPPWTSTDSSAQHQCQRASADAS